MNTTLEVNGHKYGIGKIPPITQFHITRRLAPMLAQMGISLQMLKAGADTDFLSVLGPLTDMLAKMSDDDANYVIFTCLAVVTREDSGKWTRVSTGTNMMYEDIDMATMLRLAIEVVKENLGSFMRGLPEVPQ